MATKHPPNSHPPANLGGRPLVLKLEHIAALHDIVTQRTQASQENIADELDQRPDVRVCAPTICRALRAQRIVGLKQAGTVYSTYFMLACIQHAVGPQAAYDPRA